MHRLGVCGMNNAALHQSFQGFQVKYHFTTFVTSGSFCLPTDRFSSELIARVCNA